MKLFLLLVGAFFSARLGTNSVARHKTQIWLNSENLSSDLESCSASAVGIFGRTWQGVAGAADKKIFLREKSLIGKVASELSGKCRKSLCQARLAPSDGGLSVPLPTRASWKCN